MESFTIPTGSVSTRTQAPGWLVSGFIRQHPARRGGDGGGGQRHTAKGQTPQVICFTAATVGVQTGGAVSGRAISI